jgi:hypothetical protein
MSRILLVMMLTLSLTSGGRLKYENGRHVVLPSSRLMGCASSSCSQLWQDEDANAIYPREVTVDIFGSTGSESCLRGVTALYEKSVSIDDVKAAIDQRYGKWAYADTATLPVKLWRVESEKFAISLTVTKDRTGGPTADEARAQSMGQVFGYGERSNVAEAGMPQVIYIAFVGSKCSSQ